MSPPSPFHASQKVLIAVVGNSPAVLTETVWALAHQETPWIPEQVVMITTLPGQAASENLLIQQKGWERLCDALRKEGFEQPAFGASDSIRVIGDGRRDFDDVQTPQESDAAADFILGVLRQYTEQPDTEIVASIAGGRKTLSALLMACMTLLGRTQDRVCHVLADDTFIQQNPEFLFPQSKREQNAAAIQLCDIPFVRVRGWYEKEYSGVPPSYMTLVNRFTQIAPDPANYPPVRMDVNTGVCRIGEASVRLSPSEFALLLIIAQQIKAGHPLSSWYDLEPEMQTLFARQDIPSKANWFHSLKEGGDIDTDDFRKLASSAREKLRRVFQHPGLAEALLPSMRRKTDDLYPGNKIKITDIR